MDILFSLLTLTVLEIVLGIDNLIFISILVQRLPQERQPAARTIGLGLALGLRIAFLFAAKWIADLVDPLFVMPAILGMDEPFGFSGRDLIMLAGGLFLLAKATTELHNKLEGEGHVGASSGTASFGSIITQIVALDLVFSIDSVITAIGLAKELWVMVVAVVAAIVVMQLIAKPLSAFIAQHPTVKILALAFLIMIGTVLLAEGFHVHVPKPYIYFAMAFSVGVELLNIRYRRKRGTEPVELRTPPYGS